MFMLCKAIDELPNNTDKFIGELKFDGERAIVHKKGDNIKIINRNKSNIAYKFPEIVTELKKIADDEVILDGEIVFLKEGKSDFSSLMKRALVENPFLISKRSIEMACKFMAFDLLYLNGKKITGYPLIERKKLLETIKGIERVSFTKDIKFLMGNAKAKDEEGIILKNIDSKYSALRSGEWLKLKFLKYEDVEFNSYELNDDGGITATNGFNRVRVASRVDEIKKAIDEKGKVVLEITYLGKNISGHLRQPVFNGKIK